MAPLSPHHAPDTSEEALVGAVLAGDRRALARLLTRVESSGEVAEAVVQRLQPYIGRAHVVGVTGAPGSGKSTLVAALAGELRRGGSTVSIIAVDPSSPRSGGALLGDRIRMSALAGDDGVFVRSMASRGTGGALAKQTAATAAVLDAAGYDAVLVETVGAGQGELAVADEAQTTVVVTAPGQGDEIQALKAGILEIADVLVVNKADQVGADRLVAALTFGHARGSSDLRAALAEADGSSAPWGVAVLKTVATTGSGVAELALALRRHRDWLSSSTQFSRDARAVAERRILRWAATQALERAAAAARRSGAWASLVDEVVAGRLAPSAAANAVLGGAHGTANGGLAGPATDREAPGGAGSGLPEPATHADAPPAAPRAGETAPGP